MILLAVVLLFVGLAFVILGADEAIKRILNIARFLRLSEFVISFVLAGLIAIIPELSIGVLAAVEGSSSLGLGVIFGANVADLTLVIGVVVLLTGSVHLDAAIIKNMRLSFLAVTLPVLLFFDGEISRIDGVILVAAFMLYVFNLLRTKRDGASFTGKRTRLQFTKESVILIASLGLLLAGGTLITDSSRTLSLALGLPLFIVGLIVAVGTCLPEMAFAIRSCNKLHCGLGLGNILGNVLADSMLTIGIVALISPVKPAFILPPLSTGVFMVISALIVIALARNGVLDKKAGFLLILIYVVFIAVQSIILGT